MYLVDTNVWLERLPDQARSEAAGHFFHDTPSGSLFITDFAFHSVGVVLNRLNRIEALLRFVQDAFTDGGVGLIHVEPEDIERLVRVAQQFGLDFDDAYPYVAGEKYNLTIVSLDDDFDRTERGRKTPAQVLEG